MPSSKLKPEAKARQAYYQVPKKTKAEDPAMYSKTPHAYGDVLIRAEARTGRTKLGGALQRDLVYWIERETWGKNAGSVTKVERPEYAKLSLTTLAKLCGSDRRTVARSLADLVERGIIEARDRKGCGPTVAKMYKLTPERWKEAPYYEPKALENPPEVEEDEEDDEAEAPAIPEAESTVSPGKASRPQAVAVTPRQGPPITISLVYRVEECPFPLTFSSRPGPNGKLHVSCRATAPQRFAPSSPVISPATVDTERFNDYQRFLEGFILENWGKAADEALIESIVSASGTAPLFLYEGYVREKFSGRNKHTTGLLIHIARDAARGQIARDKADRNAQQARQRIAAPTEEETAALERRLAEDLARPVVESTRKGKR